MLLFGFGLFLIWRLIGNRKVASGSNLLFVIHTVIVAIEAFAWRWLRREHKIEINQHTLRLFEVLIFGPPAVMFFIFQYQHLLFWAEKGFVPAVTSIRVWKSCRCGVAMCQGQSRMRSRKSARVMTSMPAGVPAGGWKATFGRPVVR